MRLLILFFMAVIGYVIYRKADRKKLDKLLTLIQNNPLIIVVVLVTSCLIVAGLALITLGS